MRFAPSPPPKRLYIWLFLIRTLYRWNVNKHSFITDFSINSGSGIFQEWKLFKLLSGIWDALDHFQAFPPCLLLFPDISDEGVTCDNITESQYHSITVSQCDSITNYVFPCSQTEILRSQLSSEPWWRSDGPGPVPGWLRQRLRGRVRGGGREEAPLYIVEDTNY